jgi:GTPase Era involved in 16S rRNA processing
VGAPVYLDLWVKVLPRWRKDPLQLQRLGFKLPTNEQHT